MLGFPALRTIIDGNVEFLIVAGLLCMEYGILRRQMLVFAIGIILAATKIQEVWWLFIFLPFLVNPQRIVRWWLGLLGVITAIVLPFMIWKGQEWINFMLLIPQKGSIMDSSLHATAQRLGFPAGATLFFWMIVCLGTIFIGAKYTHGYSREAVGFFLTASLLLAPYATSNNLLVLYAIAIIPMLLAGRWEGLILFGLVNLPFFFLPFPDLLYAWSASYWTFVLLAAWILLAMRMKNMKKDSRIGQKFMMLPMEQEVYSK
jgi:hypothetical protein